MLNGQYPTLATLMSPIHLFSLGSNVIDQENQTCEQVQMTSSALLIASQIVPTLPPSVCNIRIT
jgi:hypothetical protein